MTPEEFDLSVAKRYMKNGEEPPLFAPALGLCGESAELYAAIDGIETDDVVVSEMGDVLWYAASLARRLGSSFESIARPPQYLTDWTDSTDRAVAAGAMENAGNVADMVKKAVWHGRGLDVDSAHDELRHMVHAIRTLCDRHITTLEAVCAANDAKLEARYPNGFVEGGGVR